MIEGRRAQRLRGLFILRFRTRAESGLWVEPHSASRHTLCDSNAQMRQLHHEQAFGIKAVVCRGLKTRRSCQRCGSSVHGSPTCTSLVKDHLGSPRAGHPAPPGGRGQRRLLRCTLQLAHQAASILVLDWRFIVLKFSAPSWFELLLHVFDGAPETKNSLCGPALGCCRRFWQRVLQEEEAWCGAGQSPGADHVAQHCAGLPKDGGPPAIHSKELILGLHRMLLNSCAVRRAFVASSTCAWPRLPRISFILIAGWPIAAAHSPRTPAPSTFFWTNKFAPVCCSAGKSFMGFTGSQEGAFGVRWVRALDSSAESPARLPTAITDVPPVLVTF